MAFIASTLERQLNEKYVMMFNHLHEIRENIRKTRAQQLITPFTGLVWRNPLLLLEAEEQRLSREFADFVGLYGTRVAKFEPIQAQFIELRNDHLRREVQRQLMQPSPRVQVAVPTPIRPAIRPATPAAAIHAVPRAQSQPQRPNTPNKVRFQLPG